MTMRIRTLLPALLLSLAMGCANAIPSTKRDIGQAAEQFHYALRWKSFAAARMMMADDLRKELGDKLERDERALSVDRYEIKEVREREDGKIVVRVECAWYLLPSIKLNTAIYEQVWEKKEKEIRLVEWDGKLAEDIRNLGQVQAPRKPMPGESTAIPVD
ncbi:MAG: hypothetical protein GMKNLPBB_00597 [Myxococcota bacterium]|nr:hypothetical protein [Myxococcota bacterium]